MSNVFDNSGSGSESSGSARRRRRPRLPAEDEPLIDAAASAAASGAAGSAAEDDESVGNEEEELRRMRGSSAYAKYSETYQREDAKAEKERRRRQEEEEVARRRRELGSEESEADVGEVKGGIVVPDPVVGDDEDDDDIVVGPALPPIAATKGAGAAVVGSTAAASSGKPAAAAPASRARRAIDPKIMVDSSDEDDDSDSDGGGGELGPAMPPGSGGMRADGAKRAFDSLPLTHEASLGSKHDAYVSSLALDSAGSRFVTASTDSTIRLWDFGTMDSGLRSFRSVEPLGAGPVVSAQFSSTGGRILCAGALTVARVLDRDARPLVETVPGDMYIVDMARTKGHVAPLNGARWMSDQRFGTIAGDGTLRLWDAAAASAPMSAFDGEMPRAKQLKIVKLRTAKGGKKANATAMTVLEGSGSPRVAVGCDDGSIKVIDPEAFALRPSAENGSALTQGADVSAIAYRSASSLLLARSSDDALRVFDLRRFEKPLAEFLDLPNAVAQTGVSFIGESGSHFVTGTSANRRGGTDSARLVVYDSKTLSQTWDAAVEQERGSIVSVSWHSRINQLLYGCADGSVHVMYRPETSRGGVLQCLVKQVRRKVQHGMASVAVGEIYTPSSLAEATRRKKAAPVSAPEKDDAPDPSTMTSTFTKAFMKAKVKTKWADEDPRQALLRYQNDGDAKAILAEKTIDEEEEEEMNRLHSRDRVGTKRPRE